MTTITRYIGKIRVGWQAWLLDWIRWVALLFSLFYIVFSEAGTDADVKTQGMIEGYRTLVHSPLFVNIVLVCLCVEIWRYFREKSTAEPVINQRPDAPKDGMMMISRGAMAFLLPMLAGQAWQLRDWAYFIVFIALATLYGGMEWLYHRGHRPQP